MKFSKKNKLAILLLLGIGISGFILGFISPRLTLLNSEAAGWGKPQANIENKEVKFEVYDIFFVGWDKGKPSEDLNRFTLKILLNVSNPFEDTGLIIPRIDVSIGHLDLPVGRLWTLEPFSLEPFDINEDAVDTLSEQMEYRNDTGSAGLWSIYLSLYTGKGSGLNNFIVDLFNGEMGTISFDAKIDLGNYPIHVEGIFGELLKLLSLGLGGTETGSITDEPVADILFDALGADLGSINLAIRSNTIFLSNRTTDSGKNDIRALLENDNYPILNNETDKVYFGCSETFNSLYIANASGIENIEVFNATGNNETAMMDVLNATFGNNADGSGMYLWEYYNGTEWVDLTLDFDSTDGFSFTWVNDWQNGFINFTKPTDWAKTQICEFFPQNYYYIRVGVVDELIANLDNNIDDEYQLRINVKYSRIKVDIPMVPPEPEDNTVFGNGGLSLDDQTILAEQEPVIIYPGINPDNLPEFSGILQYGTGDLDEYLEDICGIELLDLLAPILNLSYGADGLLLGLTKISQKDDIEFFSEDFPVDQLVSGDIEMGRLFYNLFAFLYSHNISASDLLVYSSLDVSKIVEFLAESVPAEQFTTSALWEGSDYADDESIYNWDEQKTFTEANSYSWIIFGILGAVAILSVPYNMKNKEDQSKFLSGKDIANAKDLMEDATGKTVLIGSVPTMDNEKMRWELLGGFAGIGLGVLLYLIKDMAFPDFNDAVIFSFLPEILQSLFENSRNLDNNPYSPLVILLTAFIDFPGIFAWFIPALYVSFLRNKQFSNIKKRRVGWDVFWKGAYMIEFLLAIICLGLGVSTLLNNQTLIAYFAGGMIFIVFLFITPYFYFAIGIAGLGGFIGSRIGLKKPGEGEVTFTEEYLAEGDAHIGTSDYDEYAEYEEDEYEEYEDTDRTEIVDFDSQSAVVGMICKYCWETYPVGTDSCGKCGNTDVTQAIECPKCGNMIPIDAKFCNECGTNL
jgi:hypothetical protein